MRNSKGMNSSCDSLTFSLEFGSSTWTQMWNLAKLKKEPHNIEIQYQNKPTTTPVKFGFAFGGHFEYAVLVLLGKPLEPISTSAFVSEWWTFRFLHKVNGFLFISRRGKLSSSSNFVLMCAPSYQLLQLSFKVMVKKVKLDRTIKCPWRWRDSLTNNHEGLKCRTDCIKGQ